MAGRRPCEDVAKNRRGRVSGGRGCDCKARSIYGDTSQRSVMQYGGDRSAPWLQPIRPRNFLLQPIRSKTRDLVGHDQISTGSCCLHHGVSVRIARRRLKSCLMEAILRYGCSDKGSCLSESGEPGRLAAACGSNFLFRLTITTKTLRWTSATPLLSNVDLSHCSIAVRRSALMGLDRRQSGLSNQSAEFLSPPIRSKTRDLVWATKSRHHRMV